VPIEFASCFGASSQIRLRFLRRFYRNPLLFLNLINTDVEPNGIVSRTLNTEFVNYYLPMNLLIIRNTLEIVTCTKSFYIINEFWSEAFK